jgi:uncharacterized protein YidB (DUF937 family)
MRQRAGRPDVGLSPLRPFRDDAVFEAHESGHVAKEDVARRQPAPWFGDVHKPGRGGLRDRTLVCGDGNLERHQSVLRGADPRKDGFEQEDDMGLLEDVIGGVLSGGRGAPQGRGRSGGMSPMLMALMSYLAYRTLSGGRSTAGAPADAPARVPGGAGGGGLGDILGEILGGGQAGSPARRAPDPGGAGARAPSEETGAGLGGLGDILGNILGGGSPGGASGGRRGSGLDELSDIVQQFDKAGQGDVAQSWVGPGENKPVLPEQMSAVLDPDTVDQLAEATGIDRDELLAGMAQTLPGVVDRLTPNGRLPTPQEWQRSF